MLKFITLALALCCTFGVLSWTARLQRPQNREDYACEVTVTEEALAENESYTAIVDADFQAQDQPEQEDYIHVEGRLYRCTGEVSDIEFRCGMMDGSIESSVEPGRIPTEDGQSNFGAPYGYQYGEGGNIELLMDKKWIVFQPVDEPEKQL